VDQRKTGFYNKWPMSLLAHAVARRTAQGQIQQNILARGRRCWFRQY